MATTTESKSEAPQNLTPEEQKIYDDATRPLLDLSLVHQRVIPGIWNQVKFETFPANWCVIGHKPGLQRNKMMLQGEGPGGLRNVVQHLRDDEIQYAGFRVSVALQTENDGLETGGSANKVPPTKDLFVALKWTGRHTTPQQRENLSQEHDFMMQYFQGKDFDISVDNFSPKDSESETKGKSLQGSSRVDMIEAHVKTRIMDIAVCRADSAEQARNMRFDFANASAVGMCTHYDVVEVGASKEDEDAAMTHDALFSAMQRLQEAGDDIAYYDEAKQRNDDFVSSGGMAAFDPAIAEVNASVSRDKTSNSTGKPPRAPSTASRGSGHAIRLPTTGQESKESLAKSLPQNRSSSQQKEVLTEEEQAIDSLVRERLRVEEERMQLHRAMSELRLENQRQKNRARIQERLAERRKRLEAKKNPGPAKDSPSSPTRPAAQHANSDFFSRLENRADESRQRTAQRLNERRNSPKRRHKKNESLPDNASKSLCAIRKLDTIESRINMIERRISSLYRILKMSNNAVNTV